MPRIATNAPLAKSKRRKPLAELTETHQNYSLDKKAAFLLEVKDVEGRNVKPNITSLAAKYDIP